VVVPIIDAFVKGACWLLADDTDSTKYATKGKAGGNRDVLSSNSATIRRVSVRKSQPDDVVAVLLIHHHHSIHERSGSMIGYDETQIYCSSKLALSFEPNITC
jgi:hypothetical protein